MFVKDRMTANPVTITSVTTIVDALELMRKHQFRRLPVVDAGKLVGIITDRDLRSVSPSTATTLSIFEINYLLAKMQIKEIMKKAVITVCADATIEEAALLMCNHRIGGLVVTDANDAVCGIITETDIFKSFVDIMGLAQGKTRLTIDVSDKVGVLHDISAVFAELGINIGSMVSYALPDGRKELVIRFAAGDAAALTAKLEAKGYPVQHLAHIG